MVLLIEREGRERMEKESRERKEIVRGREDIICVCYQR